MTRPDRHRSMTRQEYLFVDGYNMIGAWPQLQALKRQDQIQAARDLLLFELSNYQKYRQNQIIVVFDAQLVPGITQSYDHHQLTVIFTQEGETADEYIEREVARYIHPLHRVVVATSDATEQWMIFQRGALRTSAQELWIDINYAKEDLQQTVDSRYNPKIRRRSPWAAQDLEQLDQLRRQIELEGKDSDLRSD